MTAHSNSTDPVAAAAGPARVGDDAGASSSEGAGEQAGRTRPEPAVDAARTSASDSGSIQRKADGACETRPPVGTPAPSGDAPPIGPEVLWTAAMLWLIGVVPSAGAGILLLSGWTSPVLAGTIGVVVFSLLTFPLARVAVVRALARRAAASPASSDEG